MHASFGVGVVNIIKVTIVFALRVCDCWRVGFRVVPKLSRQGTPNSVREVYKQKV